MIIEYLRHIDQQTFLLIYDYVDSISLLETLSFYIARYGILIFILVILYIYYRPGDDRQKIRDKKAILYLLLSLALAFLADEVINLLKVRYRPFVTFPSQVAKLNVIQDLTSFPSTHTIFVFAISISLYLSNFKKLALPLFIFSIFIGLSRIGAGVHYPFDILGGMALGIVIPIYVHYERGWIKRRLIKREHL
jgi:undecaprenyl-diphosphatase